MLALPLRLPTASYGGHMGHFLLSTIALMGSTPLGNSHGMPGDITLNTTPFCFYVLASAKTGPYRTTRSQYTVSGIR